MRFTWWTYYIAIRRSFKQEYFFFSMHTKAYAGPHKWFTQMQFTNKLKARRLRERSTAGRKLYKKQGGPW